MWRFYQYLVTQIDFIVPAMFLNQIVKHMAGMTTVSRHAHAARQEHNPGLLSGDIDAASTPLITSKVAFAIGAEAAQITHRSIKRLIGLHQPHIPVS